MKIVDHIEYSCHAGEVHIDTNNNRTYIGIFGSNVLSVLIKANALDITPLQFYRLFCEVFQPKTPQGMVITTVYKY